jgi:predicted PolB exonuclease-like 3'-5' exonuclease
VNLKSSPSTTPDYDVKNINISNLIDQLLKSDIDITSDIPEKYKHMIESNKVDNDEKTILYFLEYWKNSLNGNNLELSPK